MSQMWAKVYNSLSVGFSSCMLGDASQEAVDIIAWQGWYYDAQMPNELGSADGTA